MKEKMYHMGHRTMFGVFYHFLGVNDFGAGVFLFLC